MSLKYSNETDELYQNNFFNNQVYNMFICSLKRMMYFKYFTKKKAISFKDLSIENVLCFIFY